MHARWLLFLMCLAWVGCQCGPVGPGDDLCEGVRCGVGLTCDPTSGRCVRIGSLGGGNGSTGGGGGSSTTGGGSAAEDAGVDAGVDCATSCSGVAPVCDRATGTCKTCTDDEGCSGARPICQTLGNGGLGTCAVCTAARGCSGSTPVCDSTQPGGACVTCISADDCPVAGSQCDLGTHTCVMQGQGGGSAGGGGGSTGMVTFDDAGMTAHCLQTAPPPACTTSCREGFECVSGQCQLRGSGGPIQVTLRFNQPEDLDLHVVEPLPDAGTCEIYYAMPGNTPPPPIMLPFPVRQCGAIGWLDLDSNAACDIDNVDTENVIYASGTAATPGTYIVRVVYYQGCSATGPIPYEVEVRANGQTRYYCNQFLPGQSNGGNQGAGVTITSFTLQ